jgi:hypothetical protein
MLENIQDVAAAFAAQAQPLFYTSMWKALSETETAWRFCGIASDETMDFEGDTILRKALDISYAAQRGYVNWDHSRNPEDQLGHLTKIQVLDGRKIEDLENVFELPLSKSASVYVEGELYKHVPKAKATYDLLKSAPPGKGLGLSLDGSMARDVTSGGIVKAFVRGVAITAQPAHPMTLARLAKSLRAYDVLADRVPADIVGEIADAVIERMAKHASPAPKRYTPEQAILFVLKQRPEMTYEQADRVVKHTMNRVNGS